MIYGLGFNHIALSDIVLFGVLLLQMLSCLLLMLS